MIKYNKEFPGYTKAQKKLDLEKNSIVTELVEFKYWKNACKVVGENNAPFILSGKVVKGFGRGSK